MGGVQEPGLGHDLRADDLHLQQAPVTGAEIPTDHASFVKILNGNVEKFKGKVTAFDIEKSGVDSCSYPGQKYFPA